MIQQRQREAIKNLSWFMVTRPILCTHNDSRFRSYTRQTTNQMTGQVSPKTKIQQVKKNLISAFKHLCYYRDELVFIFLWIMAKTETTFNVFLFIVLLEIYCVANSAQIQKTFQALSNSNIKLPQRSLMHAIKLEDICQKKKLTSKTIGQYGAGSTVQALGQAKARRRQWDVC